MTTNSNFDTILGHGQLWYSQCFSGERTVIPSSRQGRMLSVMQQFSFDDCTHGSVVRLIDATRTHLTGNTEHIVQDIHGILWSCYKIACQRSVNNIAKQATDPFLVIGPWTAVNLFSPTYVSMLSLEELENSAGERPRMKRERARLSEGNCELDGSQSYMLTRVMESSRSPSKRLCFIVSQRINTTLNYPRRVPGSLLESITPSAQCLN